MDGKHGQFLYVFLENRWVGFIAFWPQRACFLSWPVSVKLWKWCRWFTAGSRGNLKMQQKKGAECLRPRLLGQLGCAEPPSPTTSGEGKTTRQASTQHDCKGGVHKHKGVNTWGQPEVSLSCSSQASLDVLCSSSSSDPKRLCPDRQTASGKICWIPPCKTGSSLVGSQHGFCAQGRRKLGTTWLSGHKRQQTVP